MCLRRIQDPRNWNGETLLWHSQLHNILLSDPPNNPWKIELQLPDLTGQLFLYGSQYLYRPVIKYGLLENTLFRGGVPFGTPMKLVDFAMFDYWRLYPMQIPFNHHFPLVFLWVSYMKSVDMVMDPCGEHRHLLSRGSKVLLGTKCLGHLRGEMRWS